MFSIRSVLILQIICAILAVQVENKSMLSIGTRIIGDQLLVKDILQARSAGLEENPTIGFNYAIHEPITCIEILSTENVFAEVNFSYHNDLVKGTIEAINNTDGFLPPFEVSISIFGFNETMLNVNPSYILNRDQDFNGVLKPLEHDDDDDFDDDNIDEKYMNLSDEALENFDDDDDFDGDATADDTNDAGEEANYENADDDIDFSNIDKEITVGHRQRDDYLLYATYQTSMMTSETPVKHSVIFYYIDSNFITFARFVIYDYGADKLVGDDSLPVAEYSHYSPSTLKAIITDYNTKSMFVQMFLYGYKPDDLPVGYVPYLTNIGGLADIATESPLSPLQRLRMLLNAQPTDSTLENKFLRKANAQSIHGDDNNDNDDNGGNNTDSSDDAAVPSTGTSMQVSKYLSIATPFAAWVLTTAVTFTAGWRF